MKIMKHVSLYLVSYNKIVFVCLFVCLLVCKLVNIIYVTDLNIQLLYNIVNIMVIVTDVKINP